MLDTAATVSKRVSKTQGLNSSLILQSDESLQASPALLKRKPNSKFNSKTKSRATSSQVPSLGLSAVYTECRFCHLRFQDDFSKKFHETHGCSRLIMPRPQIISPTIQQQQPSSNFEELGTPGLPVMMHPNGIGNQFSATSLYSVCRFCHMAYRCATMPEHEAQCNRRIFIPIPMLNDRKAAGPLIPLIPKQEPNEEGSAVDAAPTHESPKRFLMHEGQILSSSAPIDDKASVPKISESSLPTASIAAGGSTSTMPVSSQRLYLVVMPKPSMVPSPAVVPQSSLLYFVQR